MRDRRELEENEDDVIVAETLPSKQRQKRREDNEEVVFQTRSRARERAEAFGNTLLNGLKAIGNFFKAVGEFLNNHKGKIILAVLALLVAAAVTALMVFFFPGAIALGIGLVAALPVVGPTVAAFLSGLGLVGTAGVIFAAALVAETVAGGALFGAYKLAQATFNLIRGTINFLGHMGNSAKEFFSPTPGTDKPATQGELEQLQKEVHDGLVALGRQIHNETDYTARATQDTVIRENGGTQRLIRDTAEVVRVEGQGTREVVSAEAKATRNRVDQDANGVAEVVRTSAQSVGNQVRSAFFTPAPTSTNTARGPSALLDLDDHKGDASTNIPKSN